MPSSLQWLGDNPNQGRGANFVCFEINANGLVDAPASRACCVQCTLEKDTIFTLRGMCNDSFLGKDNRCFLKNLLYKRQIF